MNNKSPRLNRGFSLIELVIVIVIIGVIGAIAIPRLTSGAHNSGSAALKANLQVLRNAIELYRAEHEGAFPTVTNFNKQMLQYSNVAGTSFSTTYNAASGITRGPYLAAIPANPVGTYQGQNGVGTAGSETSNTDGWSYTESTGVIQAFIGTDTNLDKDQDGNWYSTY